MRVLMAEDEFLVALQLEQDLVAAGCTVLGPYATLEAATQACRSENFDLAILDVNLNGSMVYPLADELAAQGVPFVLLSAYRISDLPERFRAAPRVEKPYDPAAIAKLVQQARAEG